MLIKSDPNCQADGLPHLSLGYWFRTILRKRTGDKISWGGKKKFFNFLSLFFIVFQTASYLLPNWLEVESQVSNQPISLRNQLSHTQKNYLNYFMLLTHLSSLLSCPVYSPPFLLLSSVFCERNAKNKHKGMCRSVTSLPTQNVSLQEKTGNLHRVKTKFHKYAICICRAS